MRGREVFRLWFLLSSYTTPLSLPWAIINTGVTQACLVLKWLYLDRTSWPLNLVASSIKNLQHKYISLSFALIVCLSVISYFEVKRWFWYSRTVILTIAEKKLEQNPGLDGIRTQASQILKNRALSPTELTKPHVARERADFRGFFFPVKKMITSCNE